MLVYCVRQLVLAVLVVVTTPISMVGGPSDNDLAIIEVIRATRAHWEEVA